VLADAQMQLLVTLLNADASVYFRLCNGWIKCNPLFLCLWQMKAIFSFVPRLGVVLYYFQEWGPVLIRNSIYNSNKKPNIRTCSMSYIKDFLAVFYFILGELFLPECSSEFGCALKPHALLSLHVNLIKLKVQINQHKGLLCRTQSHAFCCISFHQFIQCHVSLLCITHYTLNNEMQIVPAVPWHYHSKQYLRASATRSQDCNGTSAKNSNRNCLLGLRERIC